MNKTLNNVIKLNNTVYSTENDKNDKELKTEYCFIRLYSTKYKGLCFSDLLRIGNELFTSKSKQGKRYTHAALNYKLNDNFVGLNIDDNPNDVKVENLRTTATIDAGDPKDRKNSTFDIFSLRLTESEYKLLKVNLNKVKTDNQFKYSIKKLINTAFRSGKVKVKRAVLGHEGYQDDEEDIIDLTKSKKALVCSSFVAYVLQSVSPSIKNYMEKHKKTVHDFSPNALTYLPGCKYMYGGYWTEYGKKTKEYVDKHPEFKKYIQ